MDDLQKFKDRYKIILVLTLSISVSMGSFAMDIYIPFIPFLSQEFQTSDRMIQWTLSIFMVFMSLGQLIIGPMSDKYGRKQILLISCYSFIIGSLICALTSNIYCLLLGRALQAIGACGGYAVSLACVRDSFSGIESQKIFSYFVTINGLAPIVAPILGTAIASYSGSWRFCFYYLASTGFISFYLIRNYLIEPSMNSVKVASWPTYLDIKNIFIHKTFQKWFLVPCTVMTGLFTFFSISTHYVQTTLGYDTASYSLFFGFNGIVYTAGSLCSSRAHAYISSEKMITISIVLIIVLSSVLCLHYYIPERPAMIFFICSYLMSYLYGLIIGPVTGLLLEPFIHRAGLAAALNGSLQFMVAPIMTSIFVSPPIISGRPYGLALLILSTISLYKILSTPNHK